MTLNLEKTLLLHNDDTFPDVPLLLKKNIVNFTIKCVKYLGIFVGNESEALKHNESVLERKIMSTFGKVNRSKSLSIEERIQVLNSLAYPIWRDIKRGSHLLNCYDDKHNEMSFCWSYLMLQSINDIACHVINEHRGVPNAPCTVKSTTIFPGNIFFFWYDFQHTDNNDLRPPDFVLQSTTLLLRLYKLESPSDNNDLEDLEKFMYTRNRSLN
eukprot:Awhi_evm1s10862